MMLPLNYKRIRLTAANRMINDTHWKVSESMTTILRVLDFKKNPQANMIFIDNQKRLNQLD